MGRDDGCLPSFCLRGWIDCDTTDKIWSTGKGQALGGVQKQKQMKDQFWAHCLWRPTGLSAGDIHQMLDFIKHRSAERAREKIEKLTAYGCTWGKGKQYDDNALHINNYAQGPVRKQWRTRAQLSLVYLWSPDVGLPSRDWPTSRKK